MEKYIILNHCKKKQEKLSKYHFDDKQLKKELAENVINL